MFVPPASTCFISPSLSSSTLATVISLCSIRPPPEQGITPIADDAKLAVFRRQSRRGDSLNSLHWSAARSFEGRPRRARRETGDVGLPDPESPFTFFTCQHLSFSIRIFLAQTA